MTVNARLFDGFDMGFNCPTCERTLGTRQGMRQHHTKVHGDPLPNRTCKGCGTEFYDEKARRMFCENCNPNGGENNGNWRAAKESTECRRCGSEFQYYPSDKDGVFCPECVAEADEFLGTHYAEVHGIEPVEFDCEQCGATRALPPSDVEDGRGRFCSHECKSAWMSENWRGEAHHAWKGGHEQWWYGDDWWQVRRAARERDGHECQRCGATREDLGREPDVHHIKPIREHDDPFDAHNLDNVICLCPSCHAGVESGSLVCPEPADVE